MGKIHAGIILLLGLRAASCQRNVPQSSAPQQPKADSSVAAFALYSGAEIGKVVGKAYFTSGHGNHVFFGRGGEIDGKTNPTLRVRQGQKVEITLLDLDERGQPGLNTPRLTKNGENAVLTSTAERPGTLPYTGWTFFAGKEQHTHMEGQIVIEPK